MGLTLGKIQIQMHSISQEVKKKITGNLKIKMALDLWVKPISSWFLSHF